MKLKLSLTTLLFIASINCCFAMSEQESCEYNGIDYAKAKSFVADLKKSLKSSDKEKISTMISYPLRVNNFSLDRKRTVSYIKTQKEFIRQYSQLFTKRKVNAVIKDQEIFCNYQGAMVASGFVWFKTDADKAGIFVINK